MRKYPAISIPANTLITPIISDYSGNGLKENRTQDSNLSKEQKDALHQINVLMERLKELENQEV